jgi:hypothetical protein
VGLEFALAVIAVMCVGFFVRTFRIVPQSRVGVIERLGGYQQSQ